IKVMGSLKDGYRLYKNQKRNDRELIISGEHGLNKDDYIYIRDDSERPFDSMKEINGEVHKIKEVKGNTIYLYEKLSCWKKTSLSYNIAKIDVVKGTIIDDVTIDVSKSNVESGGIRLENCVDSKIGNIDVYMTDFSSLMVKQCYNTTID